MKKKRKHCITKITLESGCEKNPSYLNTIHQKLFFFALFSIILEYAFMVHILKVGKGFLFVISQCSVSFSAFNFGLSVHITDNSDLFKYLLMNFEQPTSVA